LDNDEKIGLLVAGLIGGAALGLFLYRQIAKPSDSVAVAPAKPAIDPQQARDTFADQLEQAFHADEVDAQVHTEGTALHVRWSACSKPMIKKLLDATDDKLTRNLRKLSGLALGKLQALGFTKIVCDDTANRVVSEPI
jgi:hypothetical protein